VFGFTSWATRRAMISLASIRNLARDRTRQILDPQSSPARGFEPRSG
jgi:hypothetical protein